MARSRTASFLRAALAAALVAAGALIAIPLGPVPVTLQVFVLAVVVLVLAPAEASIALGLYAALGAVGAPVFSGGGSGVGVLAGPTGGFIIGFAAAAPAAALVRVRLARRNAEAPVSADRIVLADTLALITLLGIVYAAGWAQFALVTGRAAGDAFALAVAPFVAVDAAKCAVAALVARAVRSAGFGAD
jgi:biotin transport system substrate-specific component